jgi:Cd2+/Zn2+-exporting ATPase
MIGATEEAALVVFLFALGELLEGIAAGRARSGIKALAGIAPATAMVETPEGVVETPIEQLAVGSIIVIRPDSDPCRYRRYRAGDGELPEVLRR